jgi:hypothetical protein
MKLDINKEQIASIRQYNKRLCQYYNWVEAGKNTIFFGLITMDTWKSGYKGSFLPSYFTKDEWESDGMIEFEPKMGLYYKPHLEIKMSNGEIITKNFKTVDELIEFRKVFDGIKIINMY